MLGHRVLAMLTLGLLLVWLPTDLESLRHGLLENPRLALGVSLKIAMHGVAVIGLWLDLTAGYAFLLGASLQGLLVATGALRAIPLSQWPQFISTLWWPLLDVILRISCLLFLATRPGRIVGKEAAP